MKTNEMKTKHTSGKCYFLESVSPDGIEAAILSTNSLHQAFVWLNDRANEKSRYRIYEVADDMTKTLISELGGQQ